MEPRTAPIELTRRAFLGGMALAALAPLGCLGRHFAKKEEPKPVPKGRFVSTWDNKIAFAPDVSRGGMVMPGLVGRIYLFGLDRGTPYIGDGSLVIDLFDSTPHGPNGEPKLTDHMEVPADVLKQFAKKDFVGDGYTIFFPWFNYRPDVTQAYIQMRYTAANGESHFHQSGTFTVDHTETRERLKKNLSIAGISPTANETPVLPQPYDVPLLPQPTKP